MISLSEHQDTLSSSHTRTREGEPPTLPWWLSRARNGNIMGPPFPKWVSSCRASRRLGASGKSPLPLPPSVWRKCVWIFKCTRVFPRRTERARTFPGWKWKSIFIHSPVSGLEPATAAARGLRILQMEIQRFSNHPPSLFSRGRGGIELRKGHLNSALHNILEPQALRMQHEANRQYAVG